ncbi:hypothetical protein WSK_3148 [Novosphingobium sp. Rr 2-17]|uniref:hypothetical protein n=1 Tax=Novosphingobium sp. Rr 2-17 TaxID=555793 RepID=UPI0002698239|nr:hypothetical protein [Novosphingobium sp. Rr 2-17]EIZ78266.1 hypothetical protein WSK_3148 [Novosphingobium sp. Rr 2-17]
MRLIRVILIAGALAVLGGCSNPSDTPSPGSVTKGEARALEDAAGMLDERRPSDAATDATF